MLSSLKVTSGFATELKCLKDRTFQFPADKINVLYGPNGCGKTTILKLLGAYTGMDLTQKDMGGGWSRAATRAFYTDRPRFPECLSQLTPGKCVAEVEWDGVPAFYNSASLGDNLNMTYLLGDAKDSPDGLMDGGEQIALIMGHHSEGELRTFKLSKVVRAMQAEKPRPYVKPENDRDIDKEFAAYVRSLRGRKKKCVYTLLWDEPDRSLSIDNQIKIWTNILPAMLADDLQIIVASHSAIIPLLPDFTFMNLIDLEEGYLEQSRVQLMRIMAFRLEDKDVSRSGETAGDSPEPEQPESSADDRRDDDVAAEEPA